jgi:hypothetical protein
MQELFEAASRLKLRFETSVGLLSVEDLWDLPLTSTKANTTTLDVIAMGLYKQIQDAGTVSFVTETTRVNKVLNLKFELVKYIISTLKSEATEAAMSRSEKEQKDKIREIIRNKKEQALSDLPVEELEAML